MNGRSRRQTLMPLATKVLNSGLVRTKFRITTAGACLWAAAFAQTTLAQSSPSPAKIEFEAASIRTNPPQPGFHFAADSASGGPGTADPGMFRCTKCTLATLIAKAFDLRAYQFPGKASLPETTFDITAKIPAGATPQDFLLMQQNLLRDRFGLRYQFKEKNLKGYHLTVGKNGPKLTESTGQPVAAPAWAGRGGAGESHSHSGPVSFGGTARLRASGQTTADLARMLSDQLSLPVDDKTGLTGKYDIALTWGDTNSRDGGHGAGGGDFGGGAGHGDHGGGGAGAPQGSPGAAPGEPNGPALLDAIQQQLGLKLVSSDQTTARILIIEHIDTTPSAN
jgi:uncharacterized protein (TIGR03435 family)